MNVRVASRAGGFSILAAFEKQGFAKWLAALCEFMAKAVHRTKACANELYWPFSATPFA